MVTENPYVVDQHVYEEIDEFRSADMYSENLKGSVPSAPPPPQQQEQQQQQQQQQQQPVAEEPGGGRRSSKCGTKTSVFLVSVVFLSITVVILILAILRQDADDNRPGGSVEKLEQKTKFSPEADPTPGNLTENTKNRTKVNDSSFKDHNLYCDSYLKTLKSPPGSRRKRSVSTTPELGLDPRIFGGESVGIEYYPWQVALYFNNRYFCGGAIISENWIVTAAHCTHQKTGKGKWLVVAGDHDIQKHSESMQIRLNTEVHNHPQYVNDNTFNNDISLIKMKFPLVFNKRVRPICLPKSDAEFPDKMKCFVSGWGRTTLEGSEREKLRHVEVDIINKKTCNSPEWLGNNVSDNMLCAGKKEGGKDACVGDSGGPLSCYVKASKSWKLAGLVSWGIDCGLPKKPGVYTKLSHYTDWVWKQVLEKNNT